MFVKQSGDSSDDYKMICNETISEKTVPVGPITYITYRHPYK